MRSENVSRSVARRLGIPQMGKENISSTKDYQVMAACEHFGLTASKSEIIQERTELRPEHLLNQTSAPGQ